jgi:hypothetical protein
MKSCRVLLIALFSFFCISINAQVFVGGNFGFNTTSDKTDYGGIPSDKTSNYDFSFAPNIGKFLSEKFAIGLALDISLSGNTSGVNTETISKSSSLRGSVFFFSLLCNKMG